MDSIQQLIEQQQNAAVEIRRVISNIKKAPLDRRTLEFYQKNVEKIKSSWQSFDATENRIRRDPIVKEDHQYIQENLHETLGIEYDSILIEMEKAIQEQQSKSLEHKPSPSPRHVNDLFSASTSLQQNQDNENAKGGLVNRLFALIQVAEKTLDEMLALEVLTKDIIDSKLIRVNCNLETAQKLHDKLCLEDMNYDINSYFSFQDVVQDKIAQVKRRMTVDTVPRVDSYMQQLPKMTLPKFSGDYLNWRQFYEMFSEMVDKKPMPTIQKMWFLKTNLSGEAEALIRHLSLTESNYKTAWSMLQDRYNNTRLITATLLDKLTSQNKINSDNPSAAAIKSLHDCTREVLLALNNLGIDTKSWDTLVVHLIIKKLDKVTHVQFEQALKSPREFPTLDQLLNFLEQRFQTLETIGGKEKGKSATSASASKTSSCPMLCKEVHPLYYCPKFLGMEIGHRLNWIKKQKRCANCFQTEHVTKACKSRSCTKCELKHNTLLHLGTKSKKQTAPIPPLVDSQQVDKPQTVAAANQPHGRQGYVLLATAKVIISANNGETAEFRALLDSGSQINIVSERLVKSLSITTKRDALSIEGIGQKVSNATKCVNVSLRSKVGKYSSRLEAMVLPTIVPPQPTTQFEIGSWDIPSDIKLADPQFFSSGRIDILLGAEYYSELIMNGIIKLSPDLPILQNTKLGWVVTGKVNCKGDQTAVCAVLSEDDTATSELVRRFWELDDVDTSSKGLTLAEQQCEKHFIRNTTRNTDGRFVVRLPFAEDPSDIGETKSTACSRLLSLESRLKKDAALRAQYTEFMNQYENLGHMTRVMPEQLQGTRYYIPHHCVLKPESSTTKLRVVFDASAKSTSGSSLNDILHKGPSTQGDLFGILLRFRLPRFVFCTDIEKMYRQILVHPADRNMQLILWRNNPDEPIKHYALNTVTYGTSSAPYLATKCLQQLADQNMERFPLGAPMLRNNFYVDDGMCGSDSLTTAREMQDQLSRLLNEAGFKPRKWSANHEKLLQGIPSEDLEINLDFEDNSTKVLGLTWAPKKDQFCLKVEVLHRQSTKRTVTSDLARIFDPLGIAGPVVAAAKIFIQNLWKMNLSWDEELPKELHKTWSTFRENLIFLNNSAIPRHIFNGQQAVHTEIHTFTDASEKAYGAAVYLRSKLRNGHLIVRLLCAKSRVAPIKVVTLPRLELCAAVLGAELTAKVKREIHFQNHRTYFWSDSEIVLYWINSSPSALAPFVANRIIKIQQLTTANQWRHVRSKENPADLLSRGVSPEKFSNCSQWFYGPLFLHGDSSLWPKEFIKAQQAPITLEFKKKAICTAVTPACEDLFENIRHRNSFRSLQRIMAYVFRFISNTKNSAQHRSMEPSLTAMEMQVSLEGIVRQVQQICFGDDIKQIKLNKTTVSASSTLASLAPFIDELGVLRVRGRLEASSLPNDAKHPMILPYNHEVSKMIMTQLHKDNKHCGAQALLAISRQKFWILKGKLLARNIVHNCILCTRAKPSLHNQIMGSLPADRVTPSRPFIKSGVDYCGPFWVHYKVRGKRPHKVYIAVFCCFATKAVHLEVVTDLTTEAFIGALKRFIARRGHCQTLYSDNATNFVGAKNALVELKETIFSKESQSYITRACSDKGINFKFIPPRAPHFGGLWEAAVKSAKHLLLRTTSNASLTHEELETVVIEIEAILNSRPLTPISSDMNDMTALTPGHFLIGEPLTAQVDQRAINQTSSASTRWKLVSQLKHEFWRRWSVEYLSQLQQRNKWKTAATNLKLGQLVIIKEDNLPVMKWPLGRITQIFKGEDGTVRVVMVKTLTGEIKRPITRLAPLLNEPSTDQEEDGDVADSSQHDEPSCSAAKRPKSSDLLYTAVVLLALLPICLCNSITIHTFDNNPGIYFEGIGTTRIITAEWKIMAYYNMTPYFTELELLSQGIQTFHETCQRTTRRTMCEVISTNFEQIYNHLINDEPLLNHRHRRGAFNIVGNLARSLFGVLDAEYAEDTANKIHNIRNNIHSVADLLRNQTSVIDSTINVIKEDEFSTQSQISEIQKVMSLLSTELDKEHNQGDNTQLLTFLSTQLTLSATKLQRTEADIIDVLTDAHHGRISPLLISPQQLIDEIKTIRAYLPASRALPTEENDLIQFYKLMKVKSSITKAEIIFDIRLPLVDQQLFDLFKLNPVPSISHGHLISTTTRTPYMAVNLQRDEFIPLSTDEINKCHQFDDTFICHDVQSKQGRNSKLFSCEIRMFMNQTQANCEAKMLQNDMMWVQLKQQNNWIYSTANEIELSTVCGKSIAQIALNGSGMLHISPECLLTGEAMSIQGHYSNTSSIHTSYARFSPLEHYTVAMMVKHLQMSETKLPVPPHNKQLSELQEQIRQANASFNEQLMKGDAAQFSTTNYICYAALFASCSLLIVCTVRLMTIRRAVRIYEVPTPAPRQSTHQIDSSV